MSAVPVSLAQPASPVTQGPRVARVQQGMRDNLVVQEVPRVRQGLQGLLRVLAVLGDPQELRVLQVTRVLKGLRDTVSQEPRGRLGPWDKQGLQASLG